MLSAHCNAQRGTGRFDSPEHFAGTAMHAQNMATTAADQIIAADSQVRPGRVEISREIDASGQLTCGRIEHEATACPGSDRSRPRQPPIQSSTAGWGWDPILGVARSGHARVPAVQ